VRSDRRKASNQGQRPPEAVTGEDLTEFEYEFYRDVYYRELDHRDKIESSLTLPATVLSLVLGGAAYYLGASWPPGQGFWPVVCLLVSFALIAACALGAYNLIRVIYPSRKYYYIPTTGNIDAYVRETREYYRAKGIEKPDGIVAHDLTKELAGSFMEKAHVNAWSNYGKREYRYRAFRWLSIALLLLCLNTLAFTAKGIGVRSDQSTPSGQNTLRSK
jgi:hypothetical protein